MKLATLADGTAEGRLVVVSADLTRCSDVRHLAGTLCAALEDWDRIAPQLELVARGIESGGQPVERFHERDALAPSPSAGAFGGPDRWCAPRASVRSDGPGRGVDHAAGAAVFVGPPRGAGDRADAIAAIRLVTLVSGVRQHDGGATGWIASMGPVAVAPAALGAAWDGARLRRPLGVTVDGRPPALAEVDADFAELVVRAWRGADPAAVAVVCAGLPAHGAEGLPAALRLDVGDTVRVELRDAAGHSPFGAIEQRIEPAPEARRAALAAERA